MPPAENIATFDVIVLGAGLSLNVIWEVSCAYCLLTNPPGLSSIIAAQRMLQAHPETRLAILEGDDSVGGVWSKRTRFAPPFVLFANIFQDEFTLAFSRNRLIALPSSLILL